MTDENNKLIHPETGEPLESADYKSEPIELVDENESVSLVKEPFVKESLEDEKNFYYEGRVHVTLIHPETEELKGVDFGISFGSVFLFFVWPIIDGNFAYGLASMVIGFFLFNVHPLAMFAVWIYQVSAYNKYNISELLKKGYIPFAEIDKKVLEGNGL